MVLPWHSTNSTGLTSSTWKDLWGERSKSSSQKNNPAFQEKWNYLMAAYVG